MLHSFRRLSYKRQILILWFMNIIFLMFFVCLHLLIESSLQYWNSMWEQQSLAEVREDNKYPKFLVDTEGCKIPNFKPRDTLIFDHIIDPISTPKCSEVTYSISSINGIEGRKQRGPPLVKSNLTSMWIDRDALNFYYNESDFHTFNCCYRPFWRVQEDISKYSVDADSKVNFYNVCIPFTSTYETEVIEHEFVRVECSQISLNSHYDAEDYNWKENFSPQNKNLSAKKIALQSKEIYRDFHSFVPKKTTVEERCGKVPRKENEVSLLMLGLDSMSRLNMLREMPNLHSVLTSPPLNAISLLGHTKVGDNTFPNIMPVLTGLAEDELAYACPWPTTWHKLDPCPFIWKDFANKGYRTAYGEDASWMSIFQHLKTGFLESPTDYYIRPYLQESEREMSHSNTLHADFCIGPRMTTTSILEYLTKFCEQFQNEKYFGFFWTTSLTHDYLTAPHNGDAIFSKTIHNLTTRGTLNNTVLIVFSDHGMRWGGIRETYQGVMEERLPFAYISFPTWFEQQYPTAVANVRANAQKLTSHFDLYETVKDLLYTHDNLVNNAVKFRAKTLDSIKNVKFESIPTTTNNKPKVKPKNKLSRNVNFLVTIEDNLIYVINNGTSCNKMSEVKYGANLDRCSYWRKPRGISLFLPIPTYRTCEDAGIPHHYCTCQTSIELPSDSPLAIRIAIFVIKQLNYWLKSFEKCELLTLLNIKNARINQKSNIVNNDKIFDYTVTFITKPGKAIFEATVIETYNVELNGASGKPKLNIGGPISRLNLYGNQSYCVNDYKIKLYCYCSNS